MGLVRDILSGTVDFLKEEVLPIRYELMKAGIIDPPKGSDYQPKSAFFDPFSYNTMNYGYKERYSFLDYSKLRQISMADPILSAILITRQNQVASQSMVQRTRFANGFKIKMREHEKEPSRAAKKKIDELERFISNCGYPETFDDTPERRKRESFDTFLRKIVRDSLTFDQLNFEVTPRRNGTPGEFFAVDAATIRLVPDQAERDAVEGQQQREGQYPLLVHPLFTQNQAKIRPTKSSKFVQILQGVPRASYDEWEMAFGIRNPRTDVLANGYGYSEIEMLVSAITAHMNADTYNRRFFSQGSCVKGVLSFEGSVPPDQLEAFRRQWHQQVSGVQNAWKTPILSLGKEGKMNWVNMHNTNKEMEWGKYTEYLIKTICSCYQIDPVEIGFDISKNSMASNSTAGGLSQGDLSQRVEYSKDKGLVPLLRFIASMLNDYVIWRLDEDFELEFPVASSIDDEMDLAEKQVKTFKTVNEIRAEHDMKPIDLESIKSPGDIVLDAQFLQAFNALHQAANPQPGMGGDPMGGDPMGGGQPGQGGVGDSGVGDSGEPDYENMSTEDLEKELANLQGGAKDKEKPAKKSLRYLI